MASQAYNNTCVILRLRQSQWPLGVRRRFTVARLLGLLVRISLAAWLSVSCECCELSGSGPCDTVARLLGLLFRISLAAWLSLVNVVNCQGVVPATS